MTCPPADAPDELIDDYLMLVHYYGTGAEATPQIRAAWGDTIPETARVSVARVFKQFDADLAATALRQAYEVAKAPAHIATLKFDQAAVAGDWSQAEELCGNNAQMLLWIVPLSGDVDQWERCVARYQELAYRDRECVTSEFNIPMARGDLAAARRLADEIERFYPDGDSATERHALLDALEGNLPLARANAQIALRKDPTCNFGLQVACLVEALDGEWDRAVELAELAYEYKDPFYVAEVELIVLEAHRGGDLLEEIIGWHRGVVHEAPYDAFYDACRKYAASRSV
jgi:tetratricopeptide (TPR) repeat protein